MFYLHTTITIDSKLFILLPQLFGTFLKTHSLTCTKLLSVLFLPKPIKVGNFSIPVLIIILIQSKWKTNFVAKSSLLCTQAFLFTSIPFTSLFRKNKIQFGTSKVQIGTNEIQFGLMKLNFTLVKFISCFLLAIFKLIWHNFKKKFFF